jgi:hypothetical protein
MAHPYNNRRGLPADGQDRITVNPKGPRIRSEMPPRPNLSSSSRTGVRKVQVGETEIISPQPRRPSARAHVLNRTDEHFDTVSTNRNPFVDVELGPVGRSHRDQRPLAPAPVYPHPAEWVDIEQGAPTRPISPTLPPNSGDLTRWDHIQLNYLIPHKKAILWTVGTIGMLGLLFIVLMLVVALRAKKQGLTTSS